MHAIRGAGVRVGEYVGAGGGVFDGGLIERADTLLSFSHEGQRNSPIAASRRLVSGSKPGRVTVPGKPSDDIAPGTLNSILKQVTLKS